MRLSEVGQLQDLGTPPRINYRGQNNTRDRSLIGGSYESYPSPLWVYTTYHWSKGEPSSRGNYVRKDAPSSCLFPPPSFIYPPPIPWGFFLPPRPYPLLLLCRKCRLRDTKNSQRVTFFYPFSPSVPSPTSERTVQGKEVRLVKQWTPLPQASTQSQSIFCEAKGILTLILAWRFRNKQIWLLVLRRRPP